MRSPIHPTRAVAALAVLTVAAIVLAVTFLLWDLRQRELTHARLETVSLTRMLQEQTEQTFDGVGLVLRSVQERLQNSYGSRFPLDSLPIHLLLGARISGMPQVAGLFIVDADGTVVNSSRQHPIPRIVVADREYYKFFASGKGADLFIGRPVKNRFDNSWTLHLARPLKAPDGRLRGVIVVAMNLEHFEQMYDYMKLDFVRPIALYLDDGTLVSALPGRDSAIGTRPPEMQGVKLPPDTKDARLFAHAGANGDRQVFALGRVAHFPLMVGVTNDEEEALASWRETAIPIALGAGLVSIFIAVVAALLVAELRREEALAQALTEADDRFQRTIDSVMDAIVAVDEAQNILMFNPAAERMFGLAAVDAIGRPLEHLIPVRLREGFRRDLEDFMRGTTASRAMAPQFEITGLRADGTEFPVESSVSLATINGRPQLTAVLRDVTEWHQAEADLREMNRQLRGLSASLQNVREQERTRIARELHDELGQQLTGLKLDLSWLSGRLKEGREATPDKVDEMRRLLDTAIASVRRISAELRPLILDDLGFGEAVSWQAAEFSKRSGIDVAVDLPAAALVRDDGVATALFRIVQESLTNIAKHAGATRADIRLATVDDSLVLTVHDDGRGLTADVRHGGGIGLVSMRERTTALGGRFSIISSPGAGTTIEVTVPLAAPAQAGDEA